MFSQLNVSKTILQTKENTPIEVYIKKKKKKKIRFSFFKYMHCLENIIYDTCDYCFYKKKFFKIRINKNMFKIDYVIKNDLVD